MYTVRGMIFAFRLTASVYQTPTPNTANEYVIYVRLATQSASYVVDKIAMQTDAQKTISVMTNLTEKVNIAWDFAHLSVTHPNMNALSYPILTLIVQCVNCVFQELKTFRVNTAMNNPVP